MNDTDWGGSRPLSQYDPRAEENAYAPTKKPMKTDKLLKYAARHRMTPGDFGKMLTEPPHNLTCVEATQLMNHYKKNFPEMVRAINMQNDPGDLGVREYEKSPVSVVPPTPSVSPRAIQLPAPRTVRLPVLINRKAIKMLALDISASKRAGKFERVGKSFLDAIEAEIRLLVSRRVMSHPSKGKTLK